MIHVNALRFDPFQCISDRDARLSSPLLHDISCRDIDPEVASDVVSRVTWDPEKAESNRRKHGVRFDDARFVFFDPLVVSIDDFEHSAAENRYLAVGESISREILVVTYCVRRDEAWIISARRAEPAERRRYMQGERIRDGAVPAEEIEVVDFSKGVRGRHYIAPRGPIVVEIEPLVAECFRDATAINEALRMLIAEGRAPEPLPR